MDTSAITAETRSKRRFAADIGWPSLRFLGLGCYWAWTYVAFFSSALFLTSKPNLAPVKTAWLTSLVALVATLLITSLAAGRLGSLGDRRVFVIGAPAALSLGTVLLCVFFAYPAATFALVLGSILTGAGSALLQLLWGEFYGSIDFRHASAYTAASFAFAVGLYFVIIAMRPLGAVIATTLLPILSVASLRMSSREVEHAAPARRNEPKKPLRLPGKLVVGIFVYAAAFALMRGLVVPSNIAALDSFNRTWLLIGGLIALIVTIATIVFSRNPARDLGYVPVLPLLVAGFLLLPLLGLQNAVITNAAVVAGEMCFSILIWIVLSDYAHRLNVSSLRVFGWGRTALHGANLIGVLLGIAFAQRFAAESASLLLVSVAVVFALVLAAPLLFGNRSVIGDAEEAGAPGVAAGAASGPAAAGVVDSIAERCERLAERYGISPRELEVLVLLAKGHNLARVQEELVIARGTAQSHVRSIYNKLGVHSREELLDLVESVEP